MAKEVQLIKPRMKNLTKVILKSFFELRPKILSTILFIPFLYLMGWVLAQPLFYLNFDKENLSLIGTFFTLFLFIFLLPYWFQGKWNIKNTWEKLGINRNNIWINILHFSQGILFSLILIIIILIPILKTNYVTWSGELTPSILSQTFFYILGLGLAEELVFRAWLFEELKLVYGIKISIIFQAFVYSFIHYISDTSFLNIIGLRLGWFFLGILLSLIRVKDKGSLWRCIGIHGGLVGIWYFLNEVFIKISLKTPSYLVGPFNENLSNPLGSLCGIILIIILCIYYGNKSRIIIFKSFK